MNKHKKHLHSKQRKALKNTLWAFGAVLIVALAGIWAWKSPVVQSRVQASFGNNAAYQKKEYNKQRALAKKKYGPQTENVTVAAKTSTEKSTKTTTTVSSKNSGSAEKSAASGKYTYITVESGEYLSTIAADYNTTVDELIELNDLDSREISAGVQLKVPANNSANNSASSETDTASEQ